MQTMTAEEYAADRAERMAEHITGLRAMQDAGRLPPLDRLMSAGLERVTAAGSA
jgi:hypothetical protein